MCPGVPSSPGSPGTSHSPPSPALSPALSHGAAPACPSPAQLGTDLPLFCNLLLPGWHPQSWERTRCQDDSKGCSFLVILPNRFPHAGGASHQLRGHPGCFHKMNGGAPVAGSCHINLCSCVVLKALQSMFL